MMSHPGYMNPAPYMDPHAPQPGYMMTPQRLNYPPENPYEPQYYNANGSQFIQEQHPADPYAYNPQGRPQQSAYHQQQPYQMQQPGYAGHPSPAASPSQQQHPQQQNYQSAPQHSYPSAADQRAPFRLSHDMVEPVSVVTSSRSPAPSNRNAAPDAGVPEVHRGSVHQQPSARTPTSERSQSSAGSSRPPSAARTPATPQRNSNGLARAGSPATSNAGVLHTAMPTPSIDDMEPQNVSFIEGASPNVDEADLAAQLPRRLRNLNITSGNRTYRIPHDVNQLSPPRPALIKTFRSSPSPSRGPTSPPPVGHQTGSSSSDDGAVDDGVKTAKLKENIEADRGFIITFDDATTGPKRPKPQLGAKRPQSSSRKSSSQTAPLDVVSTNTPSYNHQHSKMDSRVSEETGRNECESAPLRSGCHFFLFLF